MAKMKHMSSKPAAFAKGGSGKMFSKISTGTQKPGQSAAAGRGGGKFAKGGSGKMFGKQPANPQKCGRSGQH